MKYAIKCLTLLSMSCIIGCTISDIDNDEPIPNVLVNLNVDAIYALKSCEGDGTSGKADIYTKLHIKASNAPNEATQTLIETTEKVYEISRFDKVDSPEISASVVITPFDGMRLEIIMASREVDPNGTHVNDTFFDILIYNADDRCWMEWNEDDCAEGSKKGKSSMFRAKESKMEDNNNVCEIDFEWSYEITPI